MNLRKSALYLFIWAPTIGFVAYLLFSQYGYYNDTIVEGEKSGFKIGTAMETSFQNLKSLENQYPELSVNLYYGDKIEDCISVLSKHIKFEEAKTHKTWELLLNGDTNRTDTIKLIFVENRLAEIQRKEKIGF